MSTITIVNDFRGNITCVSQAVYKSGNRYFVTDGGHCLAAARYLGQAYVLAEVWELP